MKEAKKQWIEKQCVIIDKEMTTITRKKTNNTLKTLTKTVSSRLVLHQTLTVISLPVVPQS
ncbi:hypothetical protein DPMN_112344 [Dreissena polymorpha]|uniref:Uncharacterized protein n=1 Tax=Dreissena polymorpha TaxID=45954 RepID=A0A9D4KFH0_DREPO|nr:hypothetical protein DPMN_112344 [Dreissena polymorpha]